jgi:hypothetical protein
MAKDEDGILGLMKRYNIPLTRENYLELAYLGDAEGKVLSWEEEANLPPQFRRKAPPYP